MTWRTVHVSDPEGLDSHGGLLKWKDDAPVREVISDKGTTRLIYDDGGRPEVVRR